MKILEVIPQLSSGGAERFVVDLCNELSINHDVTLLVLYGNNKDAFFVDELCKNVRFVNLNKKPGLDISLFFKIKKIVKKENPDIVHTHLRAIMYMLFIFIFPTSIKFIHTIHNDAKAEAGEWIGSFVRKIAFRFCGVHPVTISMESCRSFTNYYRLPSTMIYNGRPSYSLPQPSILNEVSCKLNECLTFKESCVIVNIARIQEQKNQYLLAKAIDNLNKKGYKIELVIIGSMDNRLLVEQIENIHSPFVHLLGVCDNPRDYMIAADAFCLSSLHEGMPITLIECFSVGAIPLCTPVGGIKDMIQNGRNGILSKGVSLNDLEQMLIRFLCLSNEQKEHMKIASKDSFKKYTMKICANNYLNLINSL